MIKNRFEVVGSDYQVVGMYLRLRYNGSAVTWRSKLCGYWWLVKFVWRKVKVDNEMHSNNTLVLVRSEVSRVWDRHRLRFT